MSSALVVIFSYRSGMSNTEAKEVKGNTADTKEIKENRMIPQKLSLQLEILIRIVLICIFL